MRPPGDLVYLSERKLLDLAVHFEIEAGWSETSLTMHSRAGVAGIGAGAERRSSRIDPLRERRARARTLKEVVAALEQERPLWHLDNPRLQKGPPPTQLEWFRFSRRLRFGAGHCDSDHSVRALVLVDAHAIDYDGGGQPGLLMTGSPRHLQEPYAYDDPDGTAAARSGSGTDELFRWLHDVRLAIEADRRAGLSGVADALFGRNPISERPAVALDMYSLFARDDWMKPRFPNIRQTIMCEGVGIVSLTAADDDATVLMGSPLYVRVCAPGDVVPQLERKRRRGVRRLLRGDA